MRRTITLLAIFAVSYVAAGIITPPDPYYFYSTAGMIASFGCVCYMLGLREARSKLYIIENKLNHCETGNNS